LNQLDGVPGINYKDHTVLFAAENFQEAYDGIVALIRVATRGYIRILNDVIRDQDNASKIFDEVGTRLDFVWVEVESGRWEPPAPPETQASEKKYFFAR